MSIRDRWRARTDDARRIKGDPPPTYTQLLAEIRQTQAALALAEQLATNLRHQVDGLIAENARLRTALAEKSDYIGQLALELAEVTTAKTGLMPLLSLDPDPGRPYTRDYDPEEKP